MRWPAGHYTNAEQAPGIRTEGTLLSRAGLAWMDALIALSTLLGWVCGRQLADEKRALRWRTRRPGLELGLVFCY